MNIEFLIPIRTGTGLNQRLHWAKRHKQTKTERLATRAHWPQKAWRLKCPAVVTLTRVSPGTRKADTDNAIAGLKAIRDEVALQLGVDDGDTKKIRFEYGQERGPWGVKVSISEVGDE